MKPKGKVVQRIPKEFHLVSQKNRVFTDKKKEENSKACRKKVDSKEDFELKKKMYDCKVFSIYEEKIVTPKGKIVTQSFVDHNPTVAIVAVDQDNKIILVKQYRSCVKKDLFELPAGSIDFGETPEEAAQRELSEEVGFKALKLIKLYEGYLSPGYCNEYMYFFYAKTLYSNVLPKDEDEFIIEKRFKPNEINNMIFEGKIVDAKTVLGMYLATPYLNFEEKKEN